MSYQAPSKHSLFVDLLLTILGMSLFLVCLGGVGFGVVMLAFIIAWHGWWLFALPLVPIEMSGMYALHGVDDRGLDEIH